MKIMTQKSGAKPRWQKTCKEQKGIPMLAGRQIAFKIEAFRINDVPGRATGMNDFLNTEFCNDNLKMLDQA